MAIQSIAMPMMYMIMPNHARPWIAGMPGPQQDTGGAAPYLDTARTRHSAT